MDLHGGLARKTTVAMLIALLCMMPETATAGSALFKRMAGIWTGGGHIDFSNGEGERIRCRARYTVESAGRLLEQHLRCASDSYNFNIGSVVDYHRGLLTGNWAETTHNIAGRISGTISRNHIHAHVQGAQFVASLSMSITGNSLRVILTPQAGDVREIEVALRRR